MPASKPSPADRPGRCTHCPGWSASSGSRSLPLRDDQTIALEPARVIEPPYAIHLYFTIRR